MSNLVNMERPKPQEKEKRTSEPAAIDTYYEKFPWGLRINLHTEELKKLGIDLKSFKLNQEVFISCKASVIGLEDRSSVSPNSKDGEVNENKSLELQITDLAIENPEDFEGAFKEAVEKD